jgi:hypothetical protein
MLDSSARRLSTRQPGPWPGLVVGLVLALLLAGCAGDDGEEAAPTASPTPIAQLNTAALDVPRIEFCPLVPDEAVSDALGAEPASDTAYGNGEETRLPGLGSDVVHEIGCSWTAEDGTVARAWLFARPVDAAFARTVIASGKDAKGCRLVEGPAYGRPSSTQVCRLPRGEQRIRHAGLFGQTWLTCEVSSAKGAPADLRARTDRWCVEVVNAVNTAR